MKQSIYRVSQVFVPVALFYNGRKVRESGWGVREGSLRLAARLSCHLTDFFTNSCLLSTGCAGNAWNQANGMEAA
jgi:hypothetical protein